MMRVLRYIMCCIGILVLGSGALSGCAKRSLEVEIWSQISVGMSREEVMKRIEGIKFTTSWHGEKEIILWRDRSLPVVYDCYVYVVNGVVIETDLER